MTEIIIGFVVVVAYFAIREVLDEVMDFMPVVLLVAVSVCALWLLGTAAKGIWHHI